LILHNGKLVGATLINLAGELGLIAKLIEKGADLSARKKEIAGLETNLQTLI